MGHRLSASAAKRALAGVRDELGNAARKRVESLFDLLDDEDRMRVSDVLQRLYPTKTETQALDAFRQLRYAVRQAAEDSESWFRLEVDTRKQSSPSDRRCWFEGDDPVEEDLEEFSRAETGLGGRKEPVRSRGTPLDARPLIRLFVSYAHRDAKFVDRLLDMLEDRLHTAARFRFAIWKDDHIVTGEEWDERIGEAVSDCDLGLLLLSHAFLCSEYIGSNELPPLLEPCDGTGPAGCRAIPVGLRKVHLGGRTDLKGVQPKQIHRDREGKFFSERRGEPREAWVDSLFGDILQRAEHIVAARPRSAPAVRVPRHGAPSGRAIDAAIRGSLDDECSHWVRTRGLRASLAKLDKEGSQNATSHTGNGPDPDSLDAIQYMERWALEPKSPARFALLGEYGMGKTTTCQAFTRRLLELRERGDDVPVPIYLDLRHLGDTVKRLPPLEELLGAILKRKWRYAGDDVAITPERIISLVRSGEAIAIFDGLDEVLVHLTPTQGQQFTRQLWSLLPPPPAKDDQDAPRGKLIVSCRTHFFRTLRDQKNHLTGAEREGLGGDDYRALILLPFTPDQVEEYLKRNVPDQDPERLLELIRSVHNLPELTERPYTLSLIAEHIHTIERWKAEGRAVTGVTLYKSMVLSWLERDAGKHQLTPDHKMRLMERFAAELWRSGSRTWSVQDLEQWLVDFLLNNPRIAAHYEGRDRELLKEDLRTATFLVREGEDQFRFAHTSMQEFFLASHLHRALVEGDYAGLDMAVPSRETLEFLRQLAQESGQEPIGTTLRIIRGAYRRRISELALAYALHANAHGGPPAPLVDFDLSGADLSGWRFSGVRDSPRLDMSRARFRGARLVDAEFEWVRLDDTDFTDCNLTRVEVLESTLRDASMGGASLTGTVFRDTEIESSQLARAATHRTQVVRSRAAAEAAPRPAIDPLIDGDALVAAKAARCVRHVQAYCGHADGTPAVHFAPDSRILASAGNDGTVRLWDHATGEEIARLLGHAGWVGACAFAPDGHTLASAGMDGTVRLWDVTTGEETARLVGHESWVGSCAFAADGQTLASAGNDGTVRLWHAATGEEIARLLGHEGLVWCCAFAPDGRTLASAGNDGTVFLWDSATGEEITRLLGHQDAVRGCAFAPDGRTLASAGRDGTVRLWDTVTGEETARLLGHEGLVYACSFAPDGHTLASAGMDGTVRLWDTATGEETARLGGHRGSMHACAFSPDGRSLAAAGDDDSVRLWDTTTSEETARLRGHQGRVLACAFAPDGRSLASGGDDGTVRLRDTVTGEETARLLGHEGRVFACSFAPDGHTLASAGMDGTVRLWDVPTGEETARLQGHEGWVLACAFAPDGRSLASAGMDDTIRLWDTVTGKETARLVGHESWVWACTFAPDGRSLASAGDDGTVFLWDPTTGEAIARLHGHEDAVRGCAFAPDGRTLASAGQDGTVRLWDTVTGEESARLMGQGGWLLACVFAPDGSRIASAGVDTINLWDAATGAESARLLGHEGLVLACAFAPDGSSLASTGRDGTVRVWNTATGSPSRWVAHHFDSGDVAVVTADRTRVISCTDGAWRYLGWEVRHPETNAIVRYPAEAFGPLPIVAS